MSLCNKICALIQENRHLWTEDNKCFKIGFTIQNNLRDTLKKTYMAHHCLASMTKLWMKKKIDDLHYAYNFLISSFLFLILTVFLCKKWKATTETVLFWYQVEKILVLKCKYHVITFIKCNNVSGLCTKFLTHCNGSTAALVWKNTHHLKKNNKKKQLLKHTIV